jgi:hypothetical protein
MTNMQGTYGSHYEQTRLGKMFIGNMAAAGAVLPKYDNTTQQCGLFNPRGSKINLILVQLCLTYVDTTGAAGGLCLGYKTGLDSTIATAAPGGLTAATTTVPICADLSGRLGVGIFMSPTITTAAPAVLKQLGINPLGLTATGAAATQWLARVDFDGDTIVSPGTAVFVAGNIATLSKFTCSLSWIEESV